VDTLPFVLDTDIGTDVDDALALALALRHPGLDLRAVTTVSGNTARRAAIASRLLQLAGRPEVEVATGVGGHDERAWMGHEGEGLAGLDDAPPPSDRDAVTLLVEAAAEQPLTIATIGMQSNVAAALERDPGFASRVARVAVMGGVFAPLRWEGHPVSPSHDHNLNVDPNASLRALDAGLPTLYVPCDVTFGTSLSTAALDRLRTADELCRALADLIDVWTPVLRGRVGGVLAPGKVAVLHDPLTVACLVERSFVQVAMLPVTVALHDGAVRTFVDPVGGREAEVVTAVDAEAFAEWWLDVVVGR
jgi:purine nucleosidase